LATGFGKTELVAYSLEGSGAPQEIWRQKKAIPRMPSPILVGPNVYVVNDSGVLSCFDAATGEAHYQERIGGNFASSPLYADGKLYLGSQEGVMLVLAPGPVYQKLGENTLEGAIMASPAAVGRALYLRTEHAMYRLEKKP
ncbi:MAG: PQQ-binding-like beta-propeller repeat protein, partial [Verrucomicrobiales bacterium]|nr:PQQ-binding-like beta-propeller repeat protein [Verrucomicrobiales bacterium]